MNLMGWVNFIEIIEYFIDKMIIYLNNSFHFILFQNVLIEKM